jgi:hypothetical protein
MVQSSSWAANWFAASQEIPLISQNPKVHYRIHKCPPRVSILGQPNPVHISTSRLLEIPLNIIHPSTPRSRQWSLSKHYCKEFMLQNFKFFNSHIFSPLRGPLHLTFDPYSPYVKRYLVWVSFSSSEKFWMMLMLVIHTWGTSLKFT